MSDKHEDRRRVWRRLLEDDPAARDRDVVVASDDAGTLQYEARALIDAARDASWYEQPGNEADAAVAALCRLRRAASGEKRATVGGDRAVRRALTGADEAALVWIASRMVSYMDENGFPEAVEPWLARPSGEP